MTTTRPPTAPPPPVPELLAPAGSIAAGLTAFDAGADAVYAGLPRFNARERSDNCSIEDMSRLIAYARRLGRKVYVTMNTLLKETELAEAADMAAALADLGPDAVIVQDLGLVRLLRECFPTLTLHGSTQMGLHNSAGAAFAQSIGLSRIILERQTTFEELLAIRKHTRIELELFVHGALCCGRSGSCLFSSWLGGWSGNRGKCKQPCRRRYFSPKGNGFFFSPGDLCLLENIPFLKKVGLASLKIEGRLRREDYVRAAVSAYRLVLDAPPDRTAAALAEARSKLGVAPGRKWTPGFTKPEAFRQVLQHDALGASGLLAGRVTRLHPGRFEVELSRRLLIYERIRVQPETGDEGPVFTVTRMDRAGEAVKRAEKGETVLIYCDKPVEARALVYKVGISGADLSARVQTLPFARMPVHFHVAAAPDGLTVSSPDGLFPPWHYPLAIGEARSHPLAPETLAADFAASRSEQFAAGRITAHVAGNLFLPAGALKTARRAFWEWFAREAPPDSSRPGPRGLERFRALMGQPAPPPSAARAGVTVLLPADRPSPVPGARIARPLDGADAGADEVAVPDFCPETELPALRERLRRLAARGVKRFRAGAVHVFPLVREVAPQAALVASFSIPACNSLAVRELLDRGAVLVQAWPELDAEALRALIARVGAGALEVYALGRPPILTTRAVTAVDGRVTDGRGLRFEVVREGALTRIYPELPLAIPTPPDTAAFMDLTRARPGEPATARFNYDHEWK